MEVDCEGLAVIGATLANGGVCPTSLERVIKPEAVRDVLSLLHSCGFYEYSGQFAFKVNTRYNKHARFSYLYINNSCTLIA